MNNLLPYCGLVDAKIRASDKALPVQPKKRKKRKLKKIKLEKEGTDEEWNEPKRKRGRPRVRPLGESKEEEDLDHGQWTLLYTSLCTWSNLMICFDSALFPQNFV